MKRTNTGFLAIATDAEEDSSDHPLRHTVPQYSSHRNRTEACACASITELSTSRQSRRNTRFHKSMICLTSFGDRRYSISQTRSAVRILADKNGGQFFSQNCLLNSVRVVGVSCNAVRTHQCTSNIPRQHPHLLARHEAARRTPATRLRHSSMRTILRQIIQKQICPLKGPIPRTCDERSRSSRRPQENQSCTLVEDTRERKGVAAVAWRQLECP
ncbi:hypothetical protein CLOM_g17911 [Closterium sp. NIES-68]|nr:hypothetical protein CLOM_g17911 [Closterium sp. NIES-68]